MNKKYSDGNYLINNKFNIFSYDLNPNSINNKLIYTTPLFPFSKTRYINNSLVFVDNSIDSYKFNIYYSFVYDNNIYKIYDSYGNYEEALFDHDDEDASACIKNLVSKLFGDKEEWKENIIYL